MGKIEFVGKFPKYIRFGGGCAMRLRQLPDKRQKILASYWRDGGRWGTDAKFIKGKLISCGNGPGRFKYLDNQELTPTSKYDWWQDNRQYAPIFADLVRSLKQL